MQNIPGIIASLLVVFARWRTAMNNGTDDAVTSAKLYVV
jgi:hypothetical protein